MERIDASAEGRVEVAGRWFGVRGRRFVRPTLTLVRKDGPLRALADLDDKPWAAEDGEEWRAAFIVEAGLDGAREIELTVAPDIIIELRPKGKRLAGPGAVLAVGDAARAPRFKGERPASSEGASESSAAASSAAAPVPHRPLSHAAELERLGSRLASANQALAQERERRAALAKTVEEERNTNRQLRTDLGQARSELEIAAAAQAEARAAVEELEAARRELREAQSRHDTLVRQHEDATRALTGRHDEATQEFTRRHADLARAHTELQQELQEHAESLETTRQALAEERAESGRLRNRLTQMQEARQRATPPAARASGAAPTPPPDARASGTPPTSSSSPPVSRGSGSPPTQPTAAPTQAPTSAREPDPRVSRRAPTGAGGAKRPTPGPAETQRFDVETLQEGVDVRTPAAETSRAATRRTGIANADPPAWALPQPDRLRPLNPSLRHRTYWFGRLLALLVLLGVIAAVWIVLHSTVLH